MNIHAALANPRRYRARIQRLHERYLYTPQALQQEGVSLASVAFHQAKVSRLLARAIARGEYRVGSARARTIVAEAKTRVVFSYALTDLVVHGVVADALAEAIEPDLSPGLYSYRKGHSWWRAVSRFAAYTRAHRRSRPDPRTRGLYVLRRDVEAYTDSIPVGPTSPLWPMLRRALDRSGAGAGLGPADWRLIESIVRAEVVAEDGARFTRYLGVPTGQPVSCVLFNFYLAAFDREFDAIPGGFYARYCDDILFAHPDPEVVRDVDTRMRAALARLALTMKDQKSRSLYLTGAGRASAVAPEFRGTTVVSFLGCFVTGAGTVALSRAKRRRLLADLDDRVARTATVLRGAERDTLGRAVCAVINRTLESRPSPSQQASALLLRKAVTDRPHLRQLDYMIARIVLRAVVGESGVSAFRRLPYRVIRQDWRLISLLHARNRWRVRSRGSLAGRRGQARPARLSAVGPDEA